MPVTKWSDLASKKIVRGSQTRIRCDTHTAWSSYSSKFGKMSNLLDGVSSASIVTPSTNNLRQTGSGEAAASFRKVDFERRREEDCSARSQPVGRYGQHNRPWSHRHHSFTASDTCRVSDSPTMPSGDAQAVVGAQKLPVTTTWTAVPEFVRPGI